MQSNFKKDTVIMNYFSHKSNWIEFNKISVYMYFLINSYINMKMCQELIIEVLNNRRNWKK